MELKIKGKVKVIMDTETFDSGFSKKEFVITTDEKYPQDVKLELIKDKTDLIDPYKVGSDIEVSFNVRGNEYNGRYFVNIQAWKITGATATEPTPAPAAVEEEIEEGMDDLPF
jgi:single-strand DNA-binding protein